jgi:hypothetical protein
VVHANREVSTHFKYFTVLTIQQGVKKMSKDDKKKEEKKDDKKKEEKKDDKKKEKQ